MTVRTKAAAVGKLLRGDSEKRWVVAEEVARRIHPNAILGEHAKVWITDEGFRRDFLRVSSTPRLRQLERAYALDQLSRHAATIDGDFVECGTYVGVTAWFLCRRAEGRQVHLFDSWEGLSSPTAADGDHWDAGDLKSSLAAARHTLAAFPNAVFHQGWIPDRFGDVADISVALLHLDVDLYQPTRDSLEFFYERVTPGGLMVCDDYGFATCPGARRAFDEFFADKQEVVMALPTGQGISLKR